MAFHPDVILTLSELQNQERGAMLSRIVSPPAPKPVRTHAPPSCGQRGEPQSPGPLGC